MTDRAHVHLAAARRKVRAARSLLADAFPEDSAAEAYLAMHAAARAAITTRGKVAKSHRGTWTLFAEFFVKTGLVEKRDYDAAQRARELRAAADYMGAGANSDEALVAIEDAERFVERVASALEPAGEGGQSATPSDSS